MSYFRKHILVIALILLSAASMPTTAKGRVSAEQRKEWLTELRTYKHTFLRKELQLSRDQENAFYKVYDQMEDELMNIGAETRKLERETIADQNASDVKLDATARAIFEQKRKEADIELKYFEELKNILTKRQLVKLKDAERRLNRALIDYARKKGQRGDND